VISRWAGAGGETWRPWEPFAPFLENAPRLRVPADVVTPPAAVAPTLEARDAAGAARAARLDTARRPSWRVESVTATAHRGAAPDEPVQAGRTREPDTGMAWGTLLEHAGRGPRRDRAHLERVARWLTVNNAELLRVVPEALDTVERVMASDLWRRALAAEELHADVPLAVRLEGEDGVPRILQGVIDLAFRTARGWDLVDYKTDQADMAELVTRYDEQVRAYATQWARLTGSPVTYAGLYAVREARLSPDVRGA
jgi:ATP-dependent exoDNAse (exonuclease V) beta subunit